MKKYTKKRVRFNKLSSPKKTKKVCFNNNNIGIDNNIDNDILKLQESSKLNNSTSSLFFNKANKKLLNNYVKGLTVKYKKYRKIKNYMKIRNNYLVKKFTEMNSNKKSIDKLIKSNFYDYINEQWSKENKIDNDPKYYVEVDDFRIVQNKVYYELIDYMKQYIKENPKEKKAIAINNLYKSMTTNSSDKTLLRHCKDILNTIETRTDSVGLYHVLAVVNSNEIIRWGSPIQWEVLPDEKDVTKYISHLSSAKLSIYDYLIYIDDPSDDSSTKKYKAYVKHHFFKCIRETFAVCLGNKNHGYNPQDIWDVELELLDAMGCNSIKNDNLDYYNVVTADELEKVYDFNWTEFTKNLGYKKTPQKVIVSSLNSLKCTVKLLKEKWNTPKWKTYWLYIHYRQAIRFEPKYAYIHYNFFNKILQGQPVLMPKEIYSIFGLSLCFNTFLTEQYVKHNYNAKTVNFIYNLGNTLKTIFIQKLHRNNWLSPSTKKTAIDKLTKLKLIVGIPGEMRYDPLFDYVADDSWHNMHLLTDWKHQQFIHLEGKDVIDIPEIDWQEFKLVGTQAYMVNAYYRPTSNSIYVPLAYLQAPFIDLKNHGFIYNLAFMGYTIGHELSHCLDDNGSKFDAKGNLNNWWNDHDRKIFQSKINDVVKQYETFAARDGIKFDAEIGVGEDLADISGMALVIEYLRDFMIVNNYIDIVKRNSLEEMYVYIAIQGKQKIFKKAVKAQLKINPHPLEKYRVNCPLARLVVFKAMYDIKKGDGMWWHNSDTIW
jgi:putative endopeptidase